MIFTKHSDLSWNYSVKHNIEIGVNDNLPNNQCADIIFARIKSGQTLTSHYHVRPKDLDGSDNGYESFFFFSGGHILLIGKDYEKEFNLEESFTLTFFSHEEEVHAIKNLGENDVEFQVLCAPKFDSHEEVFI